MGVRERDKNKQSNPAPHTAPPQKKDIDSKGREKGDVL